MKSNLCQQSLQQLPDMRPAPGAKASQGAAPAAMDECHLQQCPREQQGWSSASPKRASAWGEQSWGSYT